MIVIRKSVCVCVNHSSYTEFSRYYKEFIFEVGLNIIEVRSIQLRFKGRVTITTWIIKVATTSIKIDY